MCGISGVEGAVASFTIETSEENGPFTESLIARSLYTKKTNLIKIFDYIISV
jgi:hypothetical protein